MATHVLTNPYCLVDGVDLTAYVRRLAVSGTQLTEDDTAGSSVTAKAYAPTIKDESATTTFNWVLGAGAVEATLWSIYNAGTAVAFTFGPAGSVAGTATPTFTGSAILTDMPPIPDAEVGTKVEASVTWQITGGLTHNVS